MPPRERLPQEHAHRPDVALGRRLGACEPLRRDVGERPGDVADGCEGVSAVELREPEVEETNRDPVAVLEQDVRGLDVAMHDPCAMSVRERVEDLGRDLDRVLVRESIRAHRLTHGAARHVLVGDVHVARVVPDVVRANAAVVAQATCCERLPLGARGGLALPRDDLERDVEARPLVVREPDRPRATASQRPDRPIAPEYEVSGGGNRDETTPFAFLAAPPGTPLRRSFRGGSDGC